MNIKITKIVVVRESHGPDHCYLRTELPNGLWPYDGVSKLALELARGTAEEYCAKNFPGVEVEVVDVG